MVKEELVEGIRLALSKGETLDKAMMTFFNAGYPKEEIEEAAKYAQSDQLYSQFQMQLQQTAARQTTIKKTTIQANTTSSQQTTQSSIQNTQPTSQQLSQQQLTTTTSQQLFQQPIVVQRVSEYGSKKKSGKGLTIFLFVLLFLLIGFLVFIFLFREKIISFFSG
jgi:ATP-dependent Zn protease